MLCVCLYAFKMLDDVTIPRPNKNLIDLTTYIYLSNFGHNR